MDVVFVVSTNDANSESLQHVLSSYKVVTVPTLDDVLQADPTTYDLRVVALDADTFPDWEDASRQLQQAEDAPATLLVVSQIDETLLYRMQNTDLDDYIELSALPAVICHRVNQVFRTRHLQARNAHLDAFAGHVAHDLQNPLATIMGYASTLRTYYTRLSEGDVRESVDYIIDCTDQMSDTIDSMLTLARVDNGDELDIKSVPIVEVVEQVVLRLSDLIRKKQARLKFPDEWHTVMGYEPWVVEVLSNYVSNAIKYGGDPPVVELGSEYLPEGIVRVWVKDNGAGISPEDQRRVFSPFERANKGNKGTGLGLAIVQRIMKRLGGTVSVSSSSQGSIFAFTLPAPPPEQPSVSQAPFPDAHPTRPGQTTE